MKEEIVKQVPILGKQLFLGFIPMQVVWNILILIVIALILYWLIKTSRKHETPLEILKGRYAKGEISHKDFVEMKKHLSD